MNRDEQEEVFLREMDKRIWQLAEELELNTFFVIGAMEMFLMQIKMEFMAQNMPDVDGEEEEE